ncbi:hypothetical protein PYW07_012061 [Mythimna separata]|uniref:Uncharacterized protein n=1 Tax=Mythimna separata TaxID=271217 RepID=A0AAD7YLK3_MYTSE|nr:hypothetical protein PYW07_012061 [Mythimna separata]
MCNIPVTLPTLASFLMLYSLRCGCFIIWTWTLARSVFYLVFFLVTVLRMYMPDPTPENIMSRPTDDDFFCVFISYVTMIVTECFVMMFAVYLAVGLYYDSAYRVEQYLIGRFCALLIEILTLVTLIFFHHYFLGWYLVFLMIIILELYSFIVVYSYYVDIIEEQEAKECTTVCNPELSDYGDCMTYECPPDPRMQGIQDMRASRHSRAPLPVLQDCPEPRNMPATCITHMPATSTTHMPAPVITYMPEDTRMSYHSRAMRLVQEKLCKPKSDYQHQQCTRTMQDPKLCMCPGYKIPPY